MLSSGKSGGGWVLQFALWQPLLPRRGQPHITTHDDRFAVLVDDHQLSLHACSGQVLGTACEQHLVLVPGIREANVECGQVR